MNAFSSTDDADDPTCNCPTKTENIVLIGSEQYYDSFWWKMMFICPGLSAAQGAKRPPGWTPADRTTVLYVPNGYVRAELLALEQLRGQGINVVALSALSDLFTYMNTRVIDGEEHLIKNWTILAHGLHDKLDLDFWESRRFQLTIDRVRGFQASIFDPEGKIFSYACRTGVSVDGEEFVNLAAARPERSMAQAMANHFNVTVRAFYTRTLFRSCIRAPGDSDDIIAAVNREAASGGGGILDLSEEHEALPHPGQGEKNWVRGYPVDVPLAQSGQQEAGTAGYSLWRKQGARHLPTAADTPAGLPRSMATFTPAS